MGDCQGKQVCMNVHIFQVPGKNSEYRPTEYSPTVKKCCAMVVEQQKSGAAFLSSGILSCLFITRKPVPLPIPYTTYYHHQQSILL